MKNSAAHARESALNPGEERNPGKVGDNGCGHKKSKGCSDVCLENGRTRARDQWRHFCDDTSENDETFRECLEG